MPGDYEIDEIELMSGEEFAAAKARGWTKLPAETSVQLGSSVPAPVPVENPDTVWAKRKFNRGNDFTVPSGQRCKLKKLEVEDLLEAGILDQVTRLEGLAQELIDRSSGEPPTLNKVPNRENLATLLTLVNVVVPMAVVEPKVLPIPQDGEERADGVLYADDIDLMDRIAIMNESLREVAMLDHFRHS